MKKIELLIENIKFWRQKKFPYKKELLEEISDLNRELRVLTNEYAQSKRKYNKTIDDMDLLTLECLENSKKLEISLGIEKNQNKELRKLLEISEKKYQTAEAKRHKAAGSNGGFRRYINVLEMEKRQLQTMIQKFVESYNRNKKSPNLKELIDYEINRSRERKKRKK